MLPEQRDPAYLWDMLDAARTVRELAAGVSFAEYMADRKLQLAVERAIEIIGEAARQVSDDLRNAHPELPWKAMVGQRHILAHEYGRIDHTRIWVVVSKDIPELIANLEPLVPPLPPEVE